MSSPHPRLPVSRKEVVPLDAASSRRPMPGISSAPPGQASSLLPLSQKPPMTTYSESPMTRTSQGALVPLDSPSSVSSTNSPMTQSPASPMSPTSVGSTSSPSQSSVQHSLALPESASALSLTSRNLRAPRSSLSSLLPTSRDLPMPPASASPTSFPGSLVPSESFMSVTSRSVTVPPASVSSRLPTPRNFPRAYSATKVPLNSPPTPCSSATPSPVSPATPRPPTPPDSAERASPPSPLRLPWDTPVSSSATSLLWSSRSSQTSRRSSIVRTSGGDQLRAPSQSMNESERSLNAKANSQLHAIKTTMKKTLTAASRRQYSGLDFKKRVRGKYRCILHPRSRFRRWWDILILILLLMNLVLMPLHLGFFRLPGIEWQLYSLFSDFMFFADIMLNFRTGIDDRKQGIVIMDPVQIRRHYLKGWFPVDLVSSLPLDFLVLNWPAQYRNMDRRSTLSQLAKLISFVKLIKISRLFRYGGRTEQIMFYQTTGVYLQLGNILALIFLAVHWHACLQFFVGSLMGFPPKSWISIANLQTYTVHNPVAFPVQNKPWWEQYSWAVHNTVSLMMTNSYGLAHKTGLLIEEWIQVMGMFFGALWQALLLGYGANLLAHKDYTKNVQRERMQEVEEFMSYYDLPERLRARIRSHLNAQAMFLNDKDILSSLSGTLREEVLRHNYSATLTRVPFFAQADPDFTNAIAEHLNAEFYQPHDVIARRGTIGHKVYFMRSGVAHVLSETDELLDTVTEGSYFGQSCLLGPKVRQNKVVAANHCNILTLLATDFHEVIDRFPSVRGIFQTVLFEMNSQEHAERRRRKIMRRPSSVLILPELRRMGIITPSSSETTENVSPAANPMDTDTRLGSPVSHASPEVSVVLPMSSLAPDVCVESSLPEPAVEEELAANSDPENRENDDGGGWRDGSDAGGSGSHCKQS